MRILICGPFLLRKSIIYNFKTPAGEFCLCGRGLLFLEKTSYFPLQINHIHKLYAALEYGMVIIIDKEILYDM